MSRWSHGSEKVGTHDGTRAYLASCARTYCPAPYVVVSGLDYFKKRFLGPGEAREDQDRPFRIWDDEPKNVEWGRPAGPPQDPRCRKRKAGGTPSGLLISSALRASLGGRVGKWGGPPSMSRRKQGGPLRGYGKHPATKNKHKKITHRRKERKKSQAKERHHPSTRELAPQYPGPKSAGHTVITKKKQSASVSRFCLPNQAEDSVIQSVCLPDSPGPQESCLARQERET